ncbi:hypothetical protein GCM10025858_08250 [Alicyclobacillus sacchari]|nr:hypothetical protein GCM10025858_08250 [Alicyclobacillus sacchari]
MNKYASRLRELGRDLSSSVERVGADDELLRSLDTVSDEPYRAKINQMLERLQNTRRRIHGESPHGDYYATPLI